MARKPNPAAELFTASLPRIPVKPSQLDSLKADAASRGMAKKFSAYVRGKLLAKLSDPDQGMPLDDVMRNLADISCIRKAQTWDDALAHLDRITERHMNVIKP